MVSMYSELHCHSYYSFHDGASSLEELLLRAKELGYQALALTDHDNLCGAMCFAQLTRSLDMHGITGAEVTLKRWVSSHITGQRQHRLPQPFPPDYRRASKRRAQHS